MAEQFVVEGQGRQGADADLETVGRGDPVVGVVLHVPEMAELVLGPRGRPAGPNRLHGEPGHHEAIHQPQETLDLAPVDPAGRACPGPEPPLDRVPGPGVDRFLPRRVGQDPVRPGDVLGQQVCVARRVHPPGGAGDHVEVGQHGPGRGAVERLLGPLRRDRRPVGRVPVHRRRGRDDHVWPAQAVGGELGQVIDRPRPHGHRDGLDLCEGLTERLGVLDPGINRGAQHDRGDPVAAGEAERLLDIQAGRLEGPRVGHDHGVRVAELRGEDAGRVVADAGADGQGPRVPGRPEGHFERPLVFGGDHQVHPPGGPGTAEALPPRTSESLFLCASRSQSASARIPSPHRHARPRSLRDPRMLGHYSPSVLLMGEAGAVRQEDGQVL